MNTCSDCGAAVNQSDKFCSECGSDIEPPKINSDVYKETDYQAHKGGLFRNYVFDAGHVQTWEWVVMTALLFFLPPVGFFVAGWILIGCIHKVDATGTRVNPGGRSSAGLFSLILLTVGALIVSGVLLLLLLIALL
ncbi:zinc-ribbon domain-containing protein [Natrinema halophilum]|uniref:zinc-ribbon domain-containing protein n=1 Tax=Natrinema halophilum TaxID=1699371 RepID=UPI001F19ACA3|nr:zinc ribbon domain-containing protein [Natrinema halophilum]UHQ96431.1 zinc ribbon domain-containing protein [Natrinema halophilum]